MRSSPPPLVRKDEVGCAGGGCLGDFSSPEGGELKGTGDELDCVDVGVVGEGAEGVSEGGVGKPNLLTFVAGFDFEAAGAAALGA